MTGTFPFTFQDKQAPAPADLPDDGPGGAAPPHDGPGVLPLCQAEVLRQPAGQQVSQNSQ